MLIILYVITIYNFSSKLTSFLARTIFQKFLKSNLTFVTVLLFFPFC